MIQVRVKMCLISLSPNLGGVVLVSSSPRSPVKDPESCMCLFCPMFYHPPLSGLKNRFRMANSADPDETPGSAVTQW